MTRVSPTHTRRPSTRLGGWLNVVAIPLPAGILAPAGIVPAPAVGAIHMSISTIVVTFDAQLPGRLDLRPDRRLERSGVAT